jgi:hypothetical protein
MIIFVTWPLIPFGLIYWVQWYWRLLFFPSLGRPFRHRWLLMFTPVACAGVLATAELPILSDATTGERLMKCMIFVYEFACLRMLLGLFPYFGFSALADGVSRDNRAARVATIGGLVGCTLVLAIAPSAIGHASRFLLFDLVGIAIFLSAWRLVEWVTRWSEWITVRRDRRWGCFLSCLLACGGAVSGALALIIALIASK